MLCPSNTGHFKTLEAKMGHFSLQASSCVAHHVLMHVTVTYSLHVQDMRVNATKGPTAQGFLFVSRPSDEGNRANFRDAVVFIKNMGTMGERPSD
jgi:hypothetical protein